MVAVVLCWEVEVLLAVVLPSAFGQLCATVLQSPAYELVYSRDTVKLLPQCVHHWIVV